MGVTLDEDIAWALVRVAAAGWQPHQGHQRVSHPAWPERWIDVDPTGNWQSAAEVTRAARDLLDLYLPLVVRPDLVIGQLGQSLDGRIATERGDSRYVTGSADIKRLHRLRALADAVVVGASTVALDDPRLTVREVEGENPVRVVLDLRDRLDRELRVFTDGAARTIVVRGTQAGSERPPGREEPLPRGEGMSLPVTGSRGFDPALVLDALRARGLRRVLVEGGGVTVSRFLQAGLLDRLHLTVAPLLIGSGRPALTLPPIETLAAALRPRCRHFHLGDDLLFDLDFR